MHILVTGEKVIYANMDPFSYLLFEPGLVRG